MGNTPASARNLKADVVVIGGGGSGMMAACEAAKTGARVILLEKDVRVGGTTALSVGSIMAAGSDLQKREGIQDTPAAHAEDLAAVARKFGIEDNAGLRKLFTENSAESIRLLREMGVVFTDPMPQPPHRASRLHQIIPGSRSYIHHLERRCIELGVDIHAATPAKALIATGGRITGVEAMAPDGGTLRIEASRAVVLASGDVAGNADLLRTYAADGLEHVEPINPVCAGDGHTMAAAIGAKILARRDFGAAGLAQIRFIPPARRTWIQSVPPNRLVAGTMKLALKYLPAALLRPFVLSYLTATLGPDRGLFENGALLVNKHGARFADELGGPNFNDVGSHGRSTTAADADSRAPSVQLARQPDKVGYLVFDEKLRHKFSAWPHFVSTAPGVAYAFMDDYCRTRPDLFQTGATLDELAASVGFDAATLKANITDSNERRTDASKSLTEGPYYALGPVKSWVLVTPVGLAVSDRLEVLTEGGSVIPGLYAAGGVGQGGFSITGHGHGLGWAFASGLVAGRNAAATQA